QLPSPSGVRKSAHASKILNVSRTEIHGKRIELPVRRGPALIAACVPYLPAISRRSSSPFPCSSVWSVVQSGLCFECLVEERRRSPLVWTQLVRPTGCLDNA